jgi:hypothetical protein
MTPHIAPEALVALLAELDRVRAAAVTLLERDAPRLLPEPPDQDSRGERALYELLGGARRAVLGHPAAARAVVDLLVAQGRRYAATADGARLRDALVASDAVDALRRVWETASLGALDGPAAPSGVPDAWAELLAEIITGDGIDRTTAAG